MADFHHGISIRASAEDLFDYLSEVSHLPEYFSRMTSAERAGDGQIKTTAQVPDHGEVEGTAWFRPDEQARQIAWGAEGGNSYAGRLEITSHGELTRVEVHLHTTRVQEGDEQVTESLEETLENIKTLVEQRDVA